MHRRMENRGAPLISMRVRMENTRASLISMHRRMENTGAPLFSMRGRIEITQARAVPRTRAWNMRTPQRPNRWSRGHWRTGSHGSGGTRLQSGANRPLVSTCRRSRSGSTPVIRSSARPAPTRPAGEAIQRIPGTRAASFPAWNISAALRSRAAAGSRRRDRRRSPRPAHAARRCRDRPCAGGCPAVRPGVRRASARGAGAVRRACAAGAWSGGIRRAGQA